MEEIKKVAGKGDFVNKDDAKKQKETKKPKKRIIHFCSGKKNKYDELSRLFAKELPDIEIKQTDVDLPELQGYPEDIVKNKLKYALDTKAKGHPILVEDTSLCFNAYGGLPGAYVKYFINGFVQMKIILGIESIHGLHGLYREGFYGDHI